MSRILFWAFDGGGVPANPQPNRLRELHDETHVVFDEAGDGTSWRSNMIKRRQGDQLPAIRAVAYTETGLVDLTQFASLTFRMVSASTIITGVATGDASGNLTYSPAATDFLVPGTYDAYFIGIDGLGRAETFPSGENLTIVVVPTI